LADISIRKIKPTHYLVLPTLASRKPSDMGPTEGKALLPNRRGNPNWGRPQALAVMPPGQSTFEQLVATLGLFPEEYEGSSVLKEWVRKNKDHKYVPLDLLRAWGLLG
jgi:hypothetical protein